jgi:hypothetical protein
MTHRIRTTAMALAIAGLAAAAATVEAQVVPANVRVHAEIEAIDQDTRTLTLRGPLGNLFVRRVPADMPGFSTRYVGEGVTVTFLSEIALHLRKPGAALPDLSQITVPVGVPTIMRVMETEITQIDATESAVSVKGAGTWDYEATFRVPTGLSLGDFAVGDRIDVAYVFPEIVSVENQ